LLTGLLTLLIAFAGYRMLFGETPGVREGVVTIVKIGIVLALATSWGAYRTLAYDVALHGPAEVVASVGAPAGLPGAGGGLAARLQQVDNALIALNSVGTGPADMVVRTRTVDGQAVALPERTSVPPSIFGPFALGTARIVFLTATIAAFAAVRLAAGILLALGPFFIAFLLFEGTRGLFEGWIRGLVTAILGAIAVTLVLSVELALLEPWLASLIALRRAGLPIGGAASELLVASFAFALTIIAIFGMTARMTLGFRLPPMVPGFARSVLTRSLTEEGRRPVPSEQQRQSPSEQLSRAAAVAEAIARIQRQEAHPKPEGRCPTVQPTELRDLPLLPATPLGQTGQRTRRRISAGAARRDFDR
jgi:type IV secretion system protein VirB6